MARIQRQRTYLIGWALVHCVAILLCAPGWAAAQSRFSGIVVFGTSLSDSGNAFVLLGDQGTPPDFMLNPLLIPSVPYATGGHHFSNGATWVEQFGRSVGLGGSVQAALGTEDAEVTNFAIGAARAYDDGINFNLTRQVDTFLLRSGGVASPQALYAIEMGSNDIRDSFQIYASGGNGGPVLQAALGSIAANIQRLYGAGAREFLVWAAPNVALTPALRSLGPAAGGLATSLTDAFNLGLTHVVAQLSLALPGINLWRLDAYRLLNEIVDDPDAFELTNVTTPCVSANDASFSCKDAAGFLFWDGIHPTKAGHAILARETANVLQ